MPMLMPTSIVFIRSCFLQESMKELISFFVGIFLVSLMVCGEVSVGWMRERETGRVILVLLCRTMVIVIVLDWTNE